MMVDFDQLTQYVYTSDDGTLVVADMPPFEPMPEPESTGEPFVPYTPPPTLDERVATVEETIEAIFGGAE